MPDRHRCPQGTSIHLTDFSTDGRDYCDDRKAAEKEFKDLRDHLIEMQPRLYAEDRQKLLIVLQAMDAGGKDGTIRNLFKGVNPQGVKVASFKAPSKRELAHDFLWRVHRDVPGTGQIGVFNRSHYEDVLVVRVENLVPESVWSGRYELINDFERLLSETGTRILKFYLHISKEEQRERFQDRLDEPAKHYKFSMDDLRKREQWEAYQAAYEDVLSNCSTEHAPWHIIPADRKWYRNLAIMRVIIDTLEDMNPQFPQVEFDAESVTIT